MIWNHLHQGEFNVVAVNHQFQHLLYCHRNSAGNLEMAHTTKIHSPVVCNARWRMWFLAVLGRLAHKL